MAHRVLFAGDSRTALDEALRAFETLRGASPVMRELFSLVEQAAKTSSSVLITGESGTGKELIARALHSRSTRSAQPLVAVNCSSVPESLLESELFGHLKGAFTDAKSSRDGLFVRADGGTLFLDEIGDMPLALQPRLLRALQERSVRPVGGDEEVAVDVRIIAATNKNLEQLVVEKDFREDLYYRLNVIHLQVPALRERSSDIITMAQSFTAQFSAAMEKNVTDITADAAERLVVYPWPGNVRELQNAIERAVALCRGTEIDVGDLPPKIRDHKSSNALVISGEPEELVTLAELERRYVIEVLKRSGGNKRETARILGIDRKTLYRKLARWGLEPAEALARRE